MTPLFCSYCILDICIAITVLTPGTNGVMSWLKTFQWFPMSLKVQAEVLTMASESLTTSPPTPPHHLGPHLLGLSSRIIVFLLCGIRNQSCPKYLHGLFPQFLQDICVCINVCKTLLFPTVKQAPWVHLSILFLSVSAMPRRACARVETQYLLKEWLILPFPV